MSSDLNSTACESNQNKWENTAALRLCNQCCCNLFNQKQLFKQQDIHKQPCLFIHVKLTDLHNRRRDKQQHLTRCLKKMI